MRIDVFLSYFTTIEKKWIVILKKEFFLVLTVLILTALVIKELRGIILFLTILFVVFVPYKASKEADRRNSIDRQAKIYGILE